MMIKVNEKEAKNSAMKSTYHHLETDAVVVIKISFSFALFAVCSNLYTMCDIRSR